MTAGALDHCFDGLVAVSVGHQDRRSGRVRAIAVAPLQQGDHDRIKINPLVRQPVLVAGSAPRFPIRGGIQNVSPDEFAESIRQHRIGDTHMIADLWQVVITHEETVKVLARGQLRLQNVPLPDQPSPTNDATTGMT